MKVIGSATRAVADASTGGDCERQADAASRIEPAA